MLERIGKELKEARERSAMSIEQLAGKIKIDLQFLQKMEAGDFGFLPDVYIRAFVRDYAKATGLDPQQLMKKYGAAKEGKYLADDLPPVQSQPAALPAVPVEAPVQEPIPAPPPAPMAPIPIAAPPIPTVPAPITAAPPEPKKIYYRVDDYAPPTVAPPVHKGLLNADTLPYFIAGAIVLLASIIYLIIRSQGPEEIIREKPVEEIISQNAPDRFTEKPADSTALPAAAAGDSLVLSFKAGNDSCWVRVLVDGSVEKEYYFRPRNYWEVKGAASFKALMGNTRAVSVFLNGKPLEINGPRSRAEATITKDGVQQVQ